MKFKLVYRGPLKSNGGPRDKHKLRKHFHPQLEKLWCQPPLVYQKKELLCPDYTMNALVNVDKWIFSSVVNSENNLVATLDILLLQSEGLGTSIVQGGDIDNRLKTLLDALAIPQINQIPSDVMSGEPEEPFHCLLEDDKLITSIRVTVDRLLDGGDPKEVLLVIAVDVSCTKTTLENLSLIH